MQVVLQKEEYDALVAAANRKGPEPPFFWVDAVQPLEVVIKDYVTNVVNSYKGNISMAAQKLGVHRHTVSKYYVRP